MVDLETLPVRVNRTHPPVGTWLSLVEHSLGVRGVGSSNLPVPTKISRQLSALSRQPEQHHYKRHFAPFTDSFIRHSDLLVSRFEEDPCGLVYAD